MLESKVGEEGFDVGVVAWHGRGQNPSIVRSKSHTRAVQSWVSESEQGGRGPIEESDYRLPD